MLIFRNDLSGGYDFSEFIAHFVTMLENDEKNALFILNETVEVVGKYKLDLMGFEKQDLYDAVDRFPIETRHRVKAIWDYEYLTNKSDIYIVNESILGVNALDGDDEVDVSTIDNIVVLAGSGHDDVTISSNSFVYGENGNDKITILGSDNVVYGQEGHDEINVYNANNVIYGGDGNDTLFVHNLNNISVFAVEHEDIPLEELNILKISSIENIVLLDGENNKIYLNNIDNNQNISLSNAKDTVVFSGGGNDVLSSFNGSNVILYGGSGDDYLTGNNGAVLDGGDGYDTYTATGNHAVKIVDSDYTGKIIIGADQTYFKWSESEGSITKWLISKPNEQDANVISYTQYSSDSSLTQYQYTKLTKRIANLEYDAITGELSLVRDNDVYFKIQNIFGINEIEQLKNNMDVLISGTVSYRAANSFHYKEYVNTQLTFADFIEQGQVTSKYGQAEDIIYGLTQLGKDIIYAGEGNDQIYTGSGDSIVYGEDGNDYIIATDIHAVDEIYGGEGDDTIYNYDPTDEDQIINYSFYQRDKLYGGEGDDTIYVKYQYAEAYGGVGNDILIGDGMLYGGEGNDTLIAGDGGAYLDGGVGADHLIGGLGDDIFIVDEFDTFEENDPDGGYDMIHIAQSFDLALNNFEAVTLLGDQDINAYGDEFDNELIGNSGNNHLDGRTGSDYMEGGLGDDYYVVDTTDHILIDEFGNAYLQEGDQVIEQENEGIDTIERWQDARFIGYDGNGQPILSNNHRLLENNIENLILKGQAKVGFGNDLDNIIVGNEQDNYIDGLAGNDTYVYSRGGGTDTLSFHDDIHAHNILKIQGYDSSEIYAQQHGNSVLLGFRNSTDKIWLSSYAIADDVDEFGNGTSYKFDEIIFDSGETWTTTDIDALVLRAQNNHAPVVNSYPPALAVKIDEILEYTFNQNIMTDPDEDDQLSFRLTLQTQDSHGNYRDIPDWIQFDAETLTITASPVDGVDIGQLSFFLWATDLYGQSRGVGVNINIQAAANTPIAGAIYDTLGNDVLIGGVEDNIFFYTGGKDTLQDAGGIDILRFGNGISFNQVASGLMKSGNDLILKVNGSNSHQITLKNYFLAEHVNNFV